MRCQLHPLSRCGPSCSKRRSHSSARQARGCTPRYWSGRTASIVLARPKKGPGRPTHTSFDAARGAIAAAVAALVEWGDGRDTAGRLVAAELRKANVKHPNGRTITKQQVLSWRDEIGSTASQLVESTYKDMRVMYRATVSDRDGCRSRSQAGCCVGHFEGGSHIGSLRNPGFSRISSCYIPSRFTTRQGKTP